MMENKSVYTRKIKSKHVIVWLLIWFMAPEQEEVVYSGLFLLWTVKLKIPPDMPTNLFNKPGYFYF